MQKKLLSLINSVLISGTLVLLVTSCNNNDIKVQVSDIISQEGTEGIEFYFGEDQYITNENGQIEINSRRKIKEGTITTTLTQSGFMFEKAINTCQPASSFDVTSGDNIIWTRRLSYLKIITNWKQKENQYPDQYSLCFRVRNFNPTGSCTSSSCFNYAGEFSKRDDGVFVINYIQVGADSKLEIKKGENIAISCRDRCEELSIDTALIFRTTYGDTTKLNLDIF